MKKLLLFITILFMSLKSIAQTNPVFSTFTQDVDTFFQNLDKSGISTGILYDRVYPFANLPFFNVNINQPDTIDFSFYVQACGEMNRAAYTTNTTLPPAAIFLYGAEKQAANSNVVKISAFSYNFNYIDTNAITNNLLYVGGADSLLYDVPGRSYSPYILKQTTIVSPLVNSLDYSTGSFSFTFDNSYYYRNHTKSISSIVINFNDGAGDIVFNGSNSYTPLFTSEGNAYCKATVHFSDATSNTNYFILKIKNADQARIGDPVPDDEKSFLATRGFIGYDETINRFAQANIGIYYADQTIGTIKRIKKPIIITDGIDFTQSNKFQELYKDYLIYNDINDIPKSLIDELNLKGYDVIIVDFDHVTDQTVLLPNRPTFHQPGADYVERNAMVMVDIIEWVNGELVAQSINEELVIVGPSMGGLVTRWALRWMEVNSLNHNCRLWVSFDAPHRGANIPIGSQYVLEFFAFYIGNEDAKKSVAEKLDAPASRQFIIHHYSANSVVQSGAQDSRNKFYTDLETLGWPQATGLRRVSLANGSLSGILTNTPEDKSLEVEGKPSKFGGQLLTFYFHFGRQRVVGFESFFTSNSNLSKRSFYGYRFKPFGASLYYTKVAATPIGSCSLDNSPGGLYNTQQEIADEIPAETTGGTKIGLTILNIVPNNSFIPTKSALGSYNFSNWCENLYDRNLSCTNEIPFDNYFAPVGNSEEHVFLSNSGVNWIFNELDEIPEAAPADYSNMYPIQIQSGSEPICTSTSYSVANLPAGASVAWNSSGNRVVTINPLIGNPTTVTKRSNGMFNLTATISNVACVGAPFTVQRNNIQSGPIPAIIAGPYDPIEHTHMGVTCINQSYYFTAGPYDAGASYTWTLHPPPGSSEPTYLFSGSSPTISFSEVGYYTLSVSKTNSCGTVVTDQVVYTQQCYEGFSIMTSPNPATDVMLVTIDNESADVKKLSKDENIQIELYDFTSGVKQKQWTFKNDHNKFTLSLTGVAKGKYVLQVKKGNHRQLKQVLIQ